MYTVAIEAEGKLVHGRNKPTWKQAESYALALHNQVSTGQLAGAVGAHIGAVAATASAGTLAAA